MAKLTKAQNVQHSKTLDLVHSDKVLNYDEKVFIYENFNEAAATNIRAIGAFHTPLSLAFDTAVDVGCSDSLIDLCAGTGILSFAWYYRNKHNFMTPPYMLCVELESEYVALGKRLLPEAEWVQGDALTYDALYHRPGRRKFSSGVSNPPFGNIKPQPTQVSIKAACLSLKLQNV